MKDNYQKTIYACFIGYVVQAVVNNFVPLLFLTFEKTYGIPLSKITMLITLNFGVQLIVDLLSAGFVDKIGYRVSIVIAHAASALGLIGLVVLPNILPDAYTGILLSVMIYAIGGGLIEVLISPIMESCPTDNKEKAMSLLHSFYCWGHVAVVLISTCFFKIFGIENWKILACAWAIIPIVNGLIFTKAPIAPLVEEGVLDPVIDDGLRRSQRAGGQPVGVHFRRKRSGSKQSGRRSGRTDGFRHPDGKCQSVLWKIW